MTFGLLRKLLFIFCVAILSALFGAVFNHGLRYVIEAQDQARWLTLLLPCVLYVTFWSEHKVSQADFPNQTFPDDAKTKKSILTGFLTVPLTWLSHLGGASVGREGVAVQLGRSVSALMHRLLLFKNERMTELFVARCGAAAGFAAVFGAPCSAVVFSFEALSAKSLSVQENNSIHSEQLISLFFVCGCSFLSNFFAERVFGVSHTSLTAQKVDFSCDVILFLTTLAFVFLLVARVHTHLSQFLQEKRKSLMSYNKHLILVLSLCFAVLLCAPQAQQFKSLGSNFIEGFFTNGGDYLHIGYLDWFWKLILTLISVALGFKGGEVTPLLAVGSLLSFSLSSLLPWMNQIIAVAGYSGLFAAILRVPVAGAVLAIELFGANGWSGAVVCLMLLLMMNLSNFLLKRRFI